MYHTDHPDLRLKFSEVLSAKALMKIEAPIPRKLAIQVSAAGRRSRECARWSGWICIWSRCGRRHPVVRHRCSSLRARTCSVARATAVWCEVLFGQRQF